MLLTDQRAEKSKQQLKGSGQFPGPSNPPDINDGALQERPREVMEEDESYGLCLAD